MEEKKLQSRIILMGLSANAKQVGYRVYSFLQSDEGFEIYDGTSCIGENSSRRVMIEFYKKVDIRTFLEKLYSQLQFDKAIILNGSDGISARYYEMETSLDLETVKQQVSKVTKQLVSLAFLIDCKVRVAGFIDVEGRGADLIERCEEDLKEIAEAIGAKVPKLLEFKMGRFPS